MLLGGETLQVVAVCLKQKRNVGQTMLKRRPNYKTLFDKLKFPVLSTMIWSFGQGLRSLTNEKNGVKIS